MVPVQSWGDS